MQTESSLPAAASPAMSTQAANQRQRAFTRELVYMGGAGLASGLVTSGLVLIASGASAPLGALAFGSMLGLAASFADRSDGASTLRLVLGLLGGVAMTLLFSLSPLGAAALGGLFLGAAFSLDFGTPVQRVGVALAYGAALAAAVFTSSTLFGVGPLEPLKDVPVVSELLRSVIWTAFLMLPAGIKFFDWEQDPLVAKFKEARAATHDDAQKALLDEARESYVEVLSEIDRESHQDVRDRSREIAEEVARGVIALTARADEIASAVARTRERPLEARASELEARVASAKDAALRRELAAALSEVVEQMRSRRNLETAFARLSARQQRYIGALQRLHVALVESDSLTSSGSLSHSLDELSDLTERVRYTNLSVEELISDEVTDDEADAQTEQLLADLLAEASELRDGGEPRRGAPKGQAAAEDVDGESSSTGVVFDASADESDPPTDVVFDTGAPDGADGSVGASVEGVELVDASDSREEQEHDNVEAQAQATAHSR